MPAPGKTLYGASVSGKSRTLSTESTKKEKRSKKEKNGCCYELSKERKNHINRTGSLI